jgi:hypothetical protein
VSTTYEQPTNDSPGWSGEVEPVSEILIVIFTSPTLSVTELISRPKIFADPREPAPREARHHDHGLPRIGRPLARPRRAC